MNTHCETQGKLTNLIARRRKIRAISILLFLALLASALGLTLYALRNTIDLFLTPVQLRELAAPGQTLRLGGLVKPGSCIRSGPFDVHFIVTDGNAEIEVLYRGTLPDLFAEGQGVVADGILENHQRFIANQLLAKHDETYTPREVAANLQENLFTSYQDKNAQTYKNAFVDGCPGKPSGENSDAPSPNTQKSVLGRPPLNETTKRSSHTLLFTHPTRTAKT